MKKVSVYLITYNHENYIAQAIESIVAQKVNFGYEIIIGEDCSKDNTRNICEQYAEKYPGIINLLPSDRNYGPMRNCERILKACTGEYVAFCEGDDYWCDEYKLQKQVDFLEANPDFTICFSSIAVKDEMGWNKPDNAYWPVLTKDIYTIEDFILSEMSIVPTPTMLIRNVLPDPLPDFFLNAMVGDMGLQLFAAQNGKAKYINEKMAVYRNHAAGVSKSAENQEKAGEALMKLYRQFNEYSDFRFNSAFRQRFFNNAKTELIFGSRNKKGIQRLKHYLRRMREYLKYMDKINAKEIIYYHMILFFPSLLGKLKKK